MRRLVDLTEDQLKALDALAKTGKWSRAALIRQAIDEYLANQTSSPLDDAFGLWGNVDGLAYQRRLRREW